MTAGAACGCWAFWAGTVPLIVQAGYFTVDEVPPETAVAELDQPIDDGP